MTLWSNHFAATIVSMPDVIITCHAPSYPELERKKARGLVWEFGPCGDEIDRKIQDWYRDGAFSTIFHLELETIWKNPS